MFRLMMLLFAFLWSSAFDGDGGGSGAGGEGGSGGGEGGSGGADDTVSLTTEELTQRTNKAAEDRVSEIAGVLGVDLSNPADVKALIEAGRKAQQDSDSGSGSGGGEGSGVDAVLDTLEKIGERIDGLEGNEKSRQQAQAEQIRDEKLTEALKGANVRDDRMSAALTLALANGAKLNDKGELVGTSEAIAATKKALPEAFRGDGDTGDAADANGRETADRKPKTLTEALTAHYSK